MTGLLHWRPLVFFSNLNLSHYTLLLCYYMLIFFFKQSSSIFFSITDDKHERFWILASANSLAHKVMASILGYNDKWL
ncbi:hypothetical protein ACJX0J_031413, partial [Zea mays]